jgi:hypothetical protein
MFIAGQFLNSLREYANIHYQLMVEPCDCKHINSFINISITFAYKKAPSIKEQSSLLKIEPKDLMLITFPVEKKSVD